DRYELARVTRRCLGLSAVLAFALPWGAFAVCGRPALAWLIGGSPSSGPILTASLRLMGLLAIFFVFDFAINFLSSLLRAAKEQAYLLKATVAVACVFGGLLLVLPSRVDGIFQMASFIAVQALWAVLLLLRVVGRWPGTVSREMESKPRLWHEDRVSRHAAVLRQPFAGELCIAGSRKPYREA